MNDKFFFRPLDKFEIVLFREFFRRSVKFPKVIEFFVKRSKELFKAWVIVKDHIIELVVFCFSGNIIASRIKLRSYSIWFVVNEDKFVVV